MEDLIRRLRQVSAVKEALDDVWTAAILNEAADALEQLRAERERQKYIAKTPEDVERILRMIEDEPDDQDGVSTVQADDAQTPPLAAHAAELPCGHPAALLIHSVESDHSFCELCDTRAQRDDAVKMEEHWRDKYEACKAAKAVVGHAVPRDPTLAMLRVDVINGAATYYAQKDVMCSGCLLGEVWRAMYDAAVVPANPRPEPEPVRMRDTTAIVDDMLGVSGGKAESERPKIYERGFERRPSYRALPDDTIDPAGDSGGPSESEQTPQPAKDAAE